MMLAARFCAVAAALIISSQANAQGSPARAAQDIFDVRIKDSDYFEVRMRDPEMAGQSYSNVLRFATCVAQQDRAAAGSVLKTNAGSEDESRALRELSKRHKSCIVERGSVPSVLIRGALAEAMWKQAGANADLPKRTSVGVQDVEAFIKAAPLGEMKMKAGGLPLSWVARCQVMALPAESASVLAAQPGSKEEQAAAVQLYAGSNVCGVLKGLGKTPAVLVRAAVADALYQDSARMASGTAANATGAVTQTP